MGTDLREKASIEIGRRACQMIVEGMVQKARELLKEIE